MADDIRTGKISTETAEFDAAEKKVKDEIQALISNNGDTPVDDFHRRLGLIMWEKCGMARNEKQLKEAIAEIQELRKEFHSNVLVPVCF